VLDGGRARGYAICDGERGQILEVGDFYFNKNDPKIFVPKRYGFGYTLNFGCSERSSIGMRTRTRQLAKTL
jgi:hypothetical protein